MPEPRPSSSTDATILRALRRVDRRRLLNRALRHLGLGACAILGVVVLLEVARRLVGVPAPSSALVGLLGALGFTAWAIQDVVRRRSLGLAAGLADRRADLKDELKTAYFFLGRRPRSEWVETQVERAARTAGSLEPGRLVPTEIPRTTLVAAGLGLLLVALLWVPARPLLVLSAPDADPGTLGTEQQERFRDIQELFQEAEELDEDQEEGLSEEVRERLEEAMRRLEEGEIDMEEALAEMRQAENLLEEGNLEMNAMQQSLEDLARELEGAEDLGEMADALRQQDLREAAEMMRQLAERLPDLDEAARRELAEKLQESAGAERSSMEELMEALQEAAEQMSQEELQAAREAMEKAAEAMQQMARQQEAQQRMNQAAEEMQGLQQSMQQQSAAATQQEGSEQQPRGPQAQAQQMEGGAMAMPSDEVEWQEGGGDQSQPPQDPQGGPTGHASGTPQGGQQPLGDPTRLEVQLEMEVLEKEDPEEPPRPENLFEEQSRRQQASVQYRDARGRARYAEGSALRVERIPWRYRDLVKLYFLAIRPRGDDDNRNR